LTADERPVLLYDGDCGLCKVILARILALGGASRIRPVALQDPEADRLLGGIPRGERMDSFHMVMPDGSVHSAGRAFVPLFDTLPGAGPLARLAGLSPAASERFYRLIAGNRTVIGKRIPARFKQSAERSIARRAG